jgi:predicted permease
VAGESGATVREQIARVTPEFFDTLGARLAMGRPFTEQETTPQTSNAVILTNAYWREHGSPAIGTNIRLNSAPHVVVGILPVDFRFLSSQARMYLPLASSPGQRGPTERHAGGNMRHMIARLSSGATLEQAQAQIDAQNAALEAGSPRERMLAEAGFRSLVASLHADHVASVRPTLLWMQAGAFVLLLIGGVNLANLVLVRANSRVKELSIRHALGASRLHIVGEIAVETTLLTFFGGLLGLAAGAAGIRFLEMFGADRLPLGSSITLDGRIAAIALIAAVTFGVLLSIPTAWFNLRAQRTSSAHTESRGGTSNRAAQRLRHAFIVAQMALALVLLTGAGLLAQSLERAMSVSPGFQPHNVLTGEISVPWKDYGSWPARVALNERILQELSAQPGVTAVGLVNNVPLSGHSGKTSSAVKGRVRQPGESPRGHYGYGVDGDYFNAMGYTLREGRFLTSEDSRRNARVCVVDEDYARYHWPAGSPLGEKLFRGPDQRPDNEAFTVVGVVAPVKQAGMTEMSAQGAIYFPYAYRSDDRLFVTMRASGAPESLSLTLQRAVREVDPELPVSNIEAMDTRIADSLVVPRSAAMVAGIFSTIALLLSAIGAYGVISYAVAQRRREIGVRMALGARPSQIRAQFVGLATRLLIAGIVLGAIGAFLSGQAMRQLLFGVPPIHLPTMLAATLVLAAVSLIACLVPSCIAARISPLQALAEE